MSQICGVNPIREALKAGRGIERILIAQGAGGARMQEIIDLAREARVPVRFEAKQFIERAAAGQVHQGVVAYVSPQKYQRFEDLEQPDLVLVLDGVEDPHNLGAILRTADAVGAGGVIIPERRAAGLSETVAKTSAGAIEHVPVMRVVNVNRALEELKQKGYWIYGLDERGEQSHTEIEYMTPTAFVLGNEGRGLHEHTRKHCDFLISIQMYGKISSLNVSVATGVVLFEWRRQQPPVAAGE